MGSIGRSDIARATSTSTTKTTTTPTHATNGSASTALEPRGLRLRRPQPLWRAVTPSPATASLQPSPTISTTTAPFHTPSGSWRAKSQFQTAVLAPRQRRARRACTCTVRTTTDPSVSTSRRGWCRSDWLNPNPSFPMCTFTSVSLSLCVFLWTLLFYTVCRLCDRLSPEVLFASHCSES